MSNRVEFRLADWQRPVDCEAVVRMLDAYARHPMGGAEPLSDYARQHLADAMRATTGAFSVLGWRAPISKDPSVEHEAVALANCFTTLSTFACKPLINIHDLYVADNARQAGVGQQMLGFIEQLARERDCCKITLEVLTGNEGARRSYENFGFKPYTLDETSGHAVFMHKSI